MPRMSCVCVGSSFFSDLQLPQRALQHRPVDELARQVLGVARVVDPHLLQHLADDQLDVLVVDLHALALVDLLHLGHEVAGGLGVVAQVEHLDRGERALVERRAHLDHLALAHAQAGAAGEAVLLGVPVSVAGGGDRDRVAALALVDGHPPGELRQRGRRLRLAGLEQLHHPRQAVGDVEAGDAAGVERAHRELGARLADRLRRDRADGVADLAHLAGRHRPAVAGPADADLGRALEHRAHRDGDRLVVAGRLGDLLQAGAVDLVALLQGQLADLGVGCDHAADQPRPVGLRRPACGPGP